MTLRLLIGPAGSGKTQRVLDEFEAALKSHHSLDETYFFVLPSAEHTERVTNLILQRGIGGFFYRRITTLTRLIQRLFSLGEERVASSVTRFMILREILGAKPWGDFQDIQQTPGFLNLLGVFLSELKESRVDPAFFRERMNGLKKNEPELSVKYEALAGLYEAYEEELGRRGLRDRQDLLKLFRAKREAPRPGRIKKIWLDGFFDFSALQLEYLRELSLLSEEMTVTLTLDPAGEREDLFEIPARTQKALLEMGFEPQILKPVYHRSSRPALAFLERNLFSEKRAPKAPEPGDSVLFFEAVGIQGEVEMIAREILRSLRSGDYRFSDFAVLLRQIGGYEAVIRSVFERFGIPVEIHERERLKLSALAQTAVWCLQIFTEGWKREHLVNFFKSSYVRKFGKDLVRDYEWASELENQALQQGILRDRENWLRPWPGVSEEWNEKKIRILSGLAQLEDSLRAAKNFSERRSLFLDALARFEIFQASDTASDAVRRDAASFKRIEALLEEIRLQWARRADPAAGFEQFAEDFFRLVDLDLYSLHDRSKNRVQVYGVSLARQKEYRVVFAAGLLEKAFPALVKEDPILSDWERQLFNSAGGPALNLRLPRQNLERYLFYLAVTRPTERLILSCPRFDLEGKEALPSFYLEEVKSLVPAETKKQDLARPYPDFREAVNPRDLETGLMGELWHAPPDSKAQKLLLKNLLNELLLDPEIVRRFQAANQPVEAAIRDGRILEKDFFKAERTSATALEAYAKCPYKYFASRVLRLQDPRDEVNVKLKGVIRHKVLENYFRLRFEGGRPMGFEESRAFVLADLEKVMAEFPLVAERKYQIELAREEIRQMLLQFLETELERLQANPLQPRHFEFAFGRGDHPDAPALEITDGARKFRVVGSIDRIDVDPGRGTAMVMDYKTSAQSIRKDLEFGVSLQLPIYIMAVEKFLKLKPVGAQLFSLKDGSVAGFYDKAEASFYPEFASRRTSLLEPDPFRKILDQSLAYIKRYTGGMKEGQILVLPRQCDKYCPYPSVCRIEKWRLPLILEEIRASEAKSAKEGERA